ncbi:MAG: citrate synthase [Myxococcaceae bacterium]
MTAREAARLLGVKLTTLYSYAARGLLGAGANRGPGHQARYPKASVLRLKTRADARSGHAAVAGGALQWGEPVLDTSITQLTPEGPRYRGHLATQLARDGRRFEEVAELLWRDSFEAGSGWRAPLTRLDGLSPLAKRGAPLPTVIAASSWIGLEEGGRISLQPEVELSRARVLIRQLAACVGLAHGADRASQAAKQESISSTVFFALKGQAPIELQSKALERALVVLADHELNASTFAARVAAGVGAGLHACVTAALSTLSGIRHGGAADRAEAMAEQALTRGARAVVQERLAFKDSLPGFDAGAYPLGDPRTSPLMEAALELAPKDARLKTLDELRRVVREDTGAHAAVDFGLVSVSWALGLPTGSPSVLFALARTAGWVAHVLEQRGAGTTIRPRARYLPPPIATNRSSAF